jgi:hypothetical protein
VNLQTRDPTCSADTTADGRYRDPNPPDRRRLPETRGEDRLPQSLTVRSSPDDKESACRRDTTEPNRARSLRQFDCNG